MLMVFYGNDFSVLRLKGKQSILDQVDIATETIILDDDNYQPGLILGLSETASLFSPKSVYLIDFPAKTKPLFSEVLENGAALAESKNIFVFLVEGLLADEKRKLKMSATLEEIKKTESAKFNPFTLAEALSLKDNRSLWFLLQEAKRNKLSGEEIIGILWWQLKALRLASLTSTAAEAKMKDYSYSKAKKALRNFKDGELDIISKKLLDIYHQGHRGEIDLDLSLEEWVLKL